MMKNLARPNYLSPYIIWVADNFLSVVSTMFLLLFFHSLVGISVEIKLFWGTFLVSLAASLVWTRVCKTYEGIIRHTTVDEFMRILYAMILKGVTILVAAFLTQEYVGLFISTIVVADFICSVFLLMIMRVLIVNFYFHVLKFTGKAIYSALIYSTSEAAISLANYLRGNTQYRLSGFITRDSRRRMHRASGLPIYCISKAEDLEKLIDRLNVDCILFMNGADLHADEEVISCGLKHHVSLRIAPLVEAETSLTSVQLRNVQIEDLLGRDEISVNLDNIRRELTGRVIMVTGAAGSIGSELCRQLCRFSLRQLVLFDFSETALYRIDMELKGTCPECNILSVIGDVRNRARVESQIALYRPDIIFHAAAYKHVPLMEEYPCEAVRTNVWGTAIMAETAVKYNVGKFIMISSDKAVRPSSVMGATKRLAEMYVQSLGASIRQGAIPGRTSFVTTRFGNVLGSNGSVVPLFRQQIFDGGPVTVTHPDIIRYFMTIPEACRLVLEAAFMGEGNDIFIFDMGKPVKIADLATRMIELAGLRPGKDIGITYTGLRPGEKLFEELLYQKENTIPTANRKIYRARCVEYEYNDIKEKIRGLVDTAHTDDKVATVRAMKRIAPDFKSQHSDYEELDAELEGEKGKKEIPDGNKFDKNTMFN